MDEYDWNLLSLIGEGKKLNQISEELYISQPALTYRINKMEKRLSTELFIRDNRGIQPTPQGEHLISYANRMLEELKYVQEEMYSISNQVKGYLYIGASNAVARHVIPNVLNRFLKQYPEVRPHVITGFSPYLMDMLLKEKIHIAFLREDMEWDYQKKLLRTENVYIVSKDSLSLKELATLPRIEYKTNHSLQVLINQWWKENFSSPPTVTAVVDNAEVALEFVRAGLGYAVLTELGLSKEPDIERMPIIRSNGQPLTRDTWIYNSKNAEQFHTVNAFLAFAEKNWIFD